MRERRNSIGGHAGVFIAACGMAASVAVADIVTPDIYSFAVSAGNEVSFDRGVSVGGSVHSAGSFSGSSGVSISGDVFAGRTAFGSSSILGGSVYASGSTYFGSGTTVAGDIHVTNGVGFGSNGRYGSVYSSGSVSVSSGSVFGGTVSGGSVSVQNSVTVSGDVRYNSGGWVNPGAQVGGSVGGSSIAPDTWRVNGVMAARSFSSGGRGINTGSTVNVDPGSYGAVWANRGSTLRFTAGEYTFDNVGGSSYVTMVFDTTGGDITVMSTRDFSINSGAEFDVIGGGSVTVIAKDDIWFGSGADVTGSFYADDEFSMASNGEIDGTVYAGNKVWLGSGTTVSGVGAVPAPGAAAALIGVIAFGRRRR